MKQRAMYVLIWSGEDGTAIRVSYSRNKLIKIAREEVIEEQAMWSVPSACRIKESEENGEWTTWLELPEFAGSQPPPAVFRVKKLIKDDFTGVE